MRGLGGTDDPGMPGPPLRIRRPQGEVKLPRTLTLANFVLPTSDT